jgi:phosphohistidine phosphatase
MNLYLIRHADAAPLGEGGIFQDEERPLTAKGMRQTSHLAVGLQQRGVRPGLVLTSPLLRARQTAEGMLQQWRAPAPELQLCEQLAPGGSRRKLARFLADLGVDPIALVGHQPDLGCFLGWLIGSKRAQFDLAKASVAFLTSTDEPAKGSAALVWIVTPEWLGE